MADKDLIEKLRNERQHAEDFIVNIDRIIKYIEDKNAPIEWIE